MQTAALDRDCVKTQSWPIFGGGFTMPSSKKIAYGANPKAACRSNSSCFEFSHNLGRKESSDWFLQGPDAKIIVIGGDRLRAATRFFLHSDHWFDGPFRRPHRFGCLRQSTSKETKRLPDSDLCFKRSTGTGVGAARWQEQRNRLNSFCSNDSDTLFRKAQQLFR